MSGICNCAVVHARCDELWQMLLEERAHADRLAEALRLPTHDANDYNCEDWPPGQGCGGCDGDAGRDAALAAHDARRQPATEGGENA